MRSRKRKATLCYCRNTGPRPNRRLQLTAFGARDRAHFDSFRNAPRRQLKRNTLGRFIYVIIQLKARVAYSDSRHVV